MPTSGDPYYERKAVPNEFIEHVGGVGQSAAELETNRERKYSRDTGDIRKFSDKKSGWHPSDDPYYGRKPVPDSFIKGIGETGLSSEQEYENRERKFSIGGSDIRKFSDAKAGWHPSEDPYYGRKPVAKPQIEGVGETGMSAAEAFESRENKAALFDLSSDPFAQITGQGHRASVSGAAGPVAADARRRSSAVAPDIEKAQHLHSGYGGSNLAPITSRTDADEIRPSTEGRFNGYNMNTGPSTTTTTTTTTSTSLNPASDLHVAGDQSGHQVGSTGHTTFYDAATNELDGVAPHDRRL